MSVDGTNAPTYSYIFNEFGSSLVTAAARSAIGTYSLTVTPSSFKNTNLVTSEIFLASVTTDFSVSSLYVNGNFNNTFTAINMKCLDFQAGSTFDAIGKIIILVKEFYSVK